MRLRPFFLPFAICAATLILANIAMIPWSQRLPHRRKLDNIRSNKDPDIVFVGDSLLDGRLDPVELNLGAEPLGRTFKPLNAALVSTLPPDHALLMNYAVLAHPTIRTVVVGLMDFQLTTDRRLRPMDLVGNHEVGVDSRFPVSLVSDINGWDYVDRAELRLLRFVPMVANRKNAWQYIEVLRRSMAQVGMPPEKTNSLGRVADMFALEASSVEAFDEETHGFVRDSSHFNSSYEQVFATAAQHNIQVVLVVMPMSPEHRERFYSRESWHKYEDKLRALAQQRGFLFIDDSDSLKDRSAFIDGIHMAPAGAATFSRYLGKQLASVVTN